MKKYLSILILIFYFIPANASVKSDIIKKLKNTNNIKFNFIQKINKKTEKGDCTISYPKKIFCRYDDVNGKVLISDGKGLVIYIKKTNGYYYYPLKKTPLNQILDKEYLIKKIHGLKLIDDDANSVKFQIIEKEQNIDIFFDKETLQLKGWVTADIYKNINSMFIFVIKENQNIDQNIFILPSQNN